MIEKEHHSAKIVVAGDYHIYGVFDDFIKQNPAYDLFDDGFKEVLRQSDFNIFNLEDPITESRDGIVKNGPYGVGSAESLNPIQKAGFHLATFATNHSYDMKNRGIRDTMDACRAHEMEITGVGFTKEEARKIHYRKINDISFAILNFARNEFNLVSDEHGGANPLDAVDNARDIKQAKTNADFVIVIVHEGTDVFHLPYPELVKQMRFYAEMGADAILVHHARLISGYELYEGVPIFYGLGNLLHLSRIKKEHEGLLVELVFEKNKAVQFKLQPIVIDADNIKVSLAGGEKKKEILERVEQYSAIIADEKALKKNWGKFVMLKSVEYLNTASGLPRIFYRIAKKMKLLPLYKKMLLLNKKKYLAMWNTAKCQSHFEAYNHIMLDLFKEEE
jgi:poly-gamma-glutamate synthesis protein (capsule biosynthesis protein)